MPGLERGLWVLNHLAAHPHGLAASAIGQASGVPKATLYRILGVLKAHGYVVTSDAAGAPLMLGPEIRRLAACMPRPTDLVEIAQPLMAQLSARLGETVKLVVREGREAVTVAVASAPHDSRISSRVGTRLPLHLGGSQRLLLAHAPADVIDATLAGPLERRASRTITDAATIRRGFATLRRDRYVSSHSEGVEGVGAFAAAIPGPDGSVATALVAIYVHAGKSPAQRADIRRAVLDVAGELTALWKH